MEVVASLPSRTYSSTHPALSRLKVPNTSNPGRGYIEPCQYRLGCVRVCFRRRVIGDVPARRFANGCGRKHFATTVASACRARERRARLRKNTIEVKSMASRSLKKPAAGSDQAPVANSLTQLEARFADAQSRLAPRRRQMIRAILDHPEETYFLSSRELGKRFNMDAATIVRTIQVLGYDRYAEFAADLRRHFVARITPYTTMQAATREKQSVADRLRQNVDKDIANLHLLKTGLDTTQVIAVAKRIHRARRVVVVGIDLAASLAHFLAYGLAVQGFDAEAPVGSAGNLIHKIKVLDAKDLVIAISFGRCLRETVEAAQRALARSGVRAHRFEWP